MPDNMLIIILSFLFIMTGGSSAYAQMPPQSLDQDTVTEETATQPEVPKQIVNIALKDDLLSVDLVNANLGEIIRAIAQKAGFTIEGSSATFSKTMTTKFNDLEIDRGIMRLFTLVKENNYLINYDTKGAISKLEIYGSGADGSIPKTTTKPRVSPVRPQVRPPSAATSSQPALPRAIRPVTRRVPQAPPQPITPQTPSPQTSSPEQMPEEQSIGDEDLPEEDVKDSPYIPPQKKPVYIPPIKR